MRRRVSDLVAMLAIVLSFALAAPSSSLAQTKNSDIKSAPSKGSVEDFADKWVKKNGGGDSPLVNSFWPEDAALDFVVGKNSTPTMKRIHSLRPQYKAYFPV